MTPSSDQEGVRLQDVFPTSARARTSWVRERWFRFRGSGSRSSPLASVSPILEQCCITIGVGRGPYSWGDFPIVEFHHFSWVQALEARNESVEEPQALLNNGALVGPFVSSVFSTLGRI